MQFIVSNPSDHLQSFWVRGMFYEYEMLSYIKTLSPEGLYIDIGSCIGNHTLWFAGVMNKEVISFEPNMVALMMQKRNINKNGLKSMVKYHNKALSDGKGQCALSYTEGNIGMCRMIEGNKIEVDTLDSYEFDKVGLIKIDVEGMEKEVVGGAFDTIDKSKPVLFIETNKPDEILEFLPQGYLVGRQFNYTSTYEFFYE